MSASPTWPSWFGRLKTAGAARRRTTALPDFADHGTAFGLDLSLAQLARSDALPPVATPADDRQPGSDDTSSRPAR